MAKKLKLLFDFFLPRLCIACDNKLSINENIICSCCFSNLELTSNTLIESEFNRKFRKDKLIQEFSSTFIFKDNSEIQQLIHSLKYDKNFNVGKFLGTRTAEIFKDKIQNWNVDLIIPIPLHKLRKTDRGFNQAVEIAKGISGIIRVPVRTNIIKRTRFTETQTKLTLQERKVNINRAFKITKLKEVIAKKVILVDDVITTGATISECAKLLLDNGAKKIFALSVAIAE